MKKQGSKDNAFKHGAYAQEFMLWGENIKEYESLRAELNSEWIPIGCSEKELVERLIQLVWRRRRQYRFHQMQTEKLQKEIREKNKSSDFLAEILSLIAEFKGAQSVEDVEELLTQFLDPDQAGWVRMKWSSHDGDPKAWGPTIAEGLSPYRLERYKDAEEFARIVGLTVFDEALASEEKMDAAIDRTIKRLMQIKTMKQMYYRMEPKLINQLNPVTI